MARCVGKLKPSARFDPKWRCRSEVGRRFYKGGLEFRPGADGVIRAGSFAAAFGQRRLMITTCRRGTRVAVVAAISSCALRRRRERLLAAMDSPAAPRGLNNTTCSLLAVAKQLMRASPLAPATPEHQHKCRAETSLRSRRRRRARLATAGCGAQRRALASAVRAECAWKSPTCFFWKSSFDILCKGGDVQKEPARTCHHLAWPNIDLAERQSAPSSPKSRSDAMIY